MEIRRAEERDIPGLLALLEEVHCVHHRIRPDLFSESGTKYSGAELSGIIADDMRPVFVYEDGAVLGYAFCAFKRHEAVTYLYIDDICVDEKARGRGVATALFDYVKSFAKESGAFELTLNVWEGNAPARSFYEKMGMSVQKTTMEIIL